MQSHSIDLPIATYHHPVCDRATASQTQLKAVFYRIEELLNCEICTRRFLQVGVHATLLKSWFWRSWFFRVETLPIATDHHPVCDRATASQTQLSACSKNYKAKGSICVSIFDQWLLWSGSRPAVQTWSRGCQALVRKKHWTRWQQGTTSHVDVEDMELSDTTQVTGDH